MSFVDDANDGQSAAASPEEMDACLESLEVAYENLERQGTAADLVQILEQIECTRKAIASTFSVQNDSLRPRFMKVFNDCERIARVRAVLDAIQLQHHQDDMLISDDRLAQCVTACKFVESQLIDLGLSTSLEKAQRAAKSALSRRCNPEEDVVVSASPSMIPGVPKPGEEAKARTYEFEVVSDSEGENEEDKLEMVPLNTDDVPTPHEEPLMPSAPLAPCAPLPADEEALDLDASAVQFDAPILLDGWLGLRGAASDSEFKPRWFVMCQHKIRIYKDEGQYVSRGDIELTNASQVKRSFVGGDKRKYTFALWNVYYSSRGEALDTFYFNAGNIEALHMWLLAMRHEIQSLQAGLVCKPPDRHSVAPASLPQSSECRFAGWLGKRGPSIGYMWYPRWCVLEGTTFSYYEDDALKKKKGEIRLSRASRIVAFQSSAESIGDQPRHRESKPFGFLIDGDPGAGPTRRIYYFNAGNDAALRAWIHAAISFARHDAGSAGYA